LTKKYKHSCGLYAVFHSERCQTPEKGKHEELLAKNGFYAEIYNSQFAAVG